ncbi:right-handed parallel beta-helix repeat-containing protein [Lichenihabitans sp. Uapishka_5]|uniref:right-handed parallel beta-helix repeat-containing protein n=1 Tax=Lichenihabitans sp. Uapishka_5 TaxID=3037302 RepID=UPI0029E7E75F|nr:right-handed parallel beta-helix repeat-containing protein [Lichenihabitans sp. Uapishka_5]MDX7951090.1 right-handed parallel beta-helix repeat-containing protein [Lichenihabitans sp. Uapishka_5]
MPALKTGHSTFYVDPVNGSTSGDGSSAKPWRTLADVVTVGNQIISTQGHAGLAYENGTDTTLHAINATAPVKAGDLILLRSGDHGSVAISNMFNSDFITVAAAPGATPVIDKLTVVSSAKWMFQGLTFRGAASTVTGATTVAMPSGYLTITGYGDWEGQTTDIVFDTNTFEAAASTSGWTAADWLNDPYSYALRASSPCTSVTGNHFINNSNALVMTTEKGLVQGNLFESFSNDAIDITASNLLIKNNTIKNGLNTTLDPLHADGIQGWSTVTSGVTATNTNVVVDGNIVTKTGDASTTYMQGISFFDGKWSGLIVQNNVVAVNSWNGITLYGAQSSKVLNNTVVSSDPTGHPSWIQIHDAKDGTVSSGVTVRNNIATQLDIASGNTAFDHNIAAASITTYPSGTKTVISSGSTGTANSVLPAVLSGFVTLNTATGSFDLRLRSTSVAIGFGTATSAPALDILAKARTAPVDVGAYVH